MDTKNDPPDDQFQRFTSVVDTLLAVPKEELKRREEAYRVEADKNPRKRGPKPKRDKS